jgi:outer membrane protein TolC
LKNRKHKYLGFLWVILLLTGLQYQTFGQSDSATILGFDEYLEIVRKEHPISYRAELQVAKAKANTLRAKGNFDPILAGDLNQKYFKDDQYYDILNAGVKVPTWFGVTFEAGYDNNQGTRLNPENYTPDQGLWFAGVKVPIGKGLIIDKRRAEWRQSKVFVKSTEQEQRIILNELILNASESYWKWFKAYNKMKVYEEAVENARIRLQNIRVNVRVGDRPVIDTLEASIQLQNRLIGQQEAILDFNNSKQLLEIYLWREGFFPLELNENTFPPLFTLDMASNPDLILFSSIDSLKYTHPEILKSQYKIESKEIKQKLLKENFKPKLDLKYNAISQPVSDNVIGNYNPNDYTWGASVSFPLFLRKERGELRLNKTEIGELTAELDFKVEQIEYKAMAAFNNWSISVNQINLNGENVDNYLRLLNGEQNLFDNGESSLFLINSREKSYIDSQLKLIDAISNNQQADIYARYALGILF